ncbi:MAG TPA: SUMF1/EgtB/PvdO family nonheme iron enzyme [Gemmatales bacterium]|nr:SUMF1/EgtB/PvdO family nonheme iron enzyme [Gemmatales bacterium]
MNKPELFDQAHHEAATLNPSPVRLPDDKRSVNIGRYRVDRVLGKGGFGLVYLAHDDQLQRLVAIKVPNVAQASKTEDAQAYLTEARTVASLDHPHIVSVYDVGSTEEYPCYIVSKFIEGRSLAQRNKEERLTTCEAVTLVAEVADALHYAHKRGLVHRDVKPGNILLDQNNTPFLADFGLALKEQDYGKGGGICGTPTYMSPEQANGEGHRVDGRSDIFSLGVVFYELLVGRCPFRGDTTDILIQIVSDEPKPPRQVDDSIPKELERICLKALSKRASERYSTAKDMADDLRHFLAIEPSASTRSLNKPALTPAVPSPSTVAGKDSANTPITPGSVSQPIRVVPKGLRSFDANDADFFLELLPGPRDREGLPDSLRFWKTRIEETDADNTFTVGLIYGPSGCGKSSLVKAGLLPHLCDKIIAVYVEATAEDTETRLLNGLRKRCTDLASNLSLKETLASLRRGQGIPVGKKVVIILDQFEQWLHAKKEEQNTELVQALRQCDGEQVQCIVMVRDDFWMSATRFMRDLEVRLVEGQNSGAVDLFDLDHARKVLAAFGRAFAKLPARSVELSKDQKDFLKESVAGLAQEKKIISVRLALFAEMMKSKPWTMASLKEVGGAQGVGVAFLEETFSASTAPPEHRYHQNAARSILRAMLPDSGTNIKGHMRSYAELLDASGYGNRPKEFDDLIHILDSEIRLITPTDPEGKEDTQVEPGGVSPRSADKHYQLTHDYLVPSLRDWVTRKQKETRRGRAELLLADRAVVWNARPEYRQLPSLPQWLSIACLTKRKNWTDPQRKMMSKAIIYHVGRTLLLALFAGAFALYRWHDQGQTMAHGIRDNMQRFAVNDVRNLYLELKDYRRWADPLLYEGLAQAKADQNPLRQLNYSLALLPVDPSQESYLYERLLKATPQECKAIRDSLADRKDELTEKLWTVVEKQPGRDPARLRAAFALATYDPTSPRWNAVTAAVAQDLVEVNPLLLGHWSTGFRPIKEKLVDPLTLIFNDHSTERTSERNLATNLLVEYAGNQPKVMADLLMNADEKQFAAIYPKFKELGEQGAPLLIAEIEKKLPAELPSSDDKREKLAKRQANAAVALLRMNQPAKVWPLLQHSPDPRVRSYVIHRLSPLGADPKAIISRLEEEPDITIRRALLLSLGEYSDQELPPSERQALLPKLQEMYRTNADPGLQAATEWLLRTWKQEPWLKQVNEEWAKDKGQREKRQEEIGKALAKDKEKTLPQWYVNSQGQTMIVIPGPVEFLMGSPETEKDRYSSEGQHRRRISRTFAISSTSVTKEQMLRMSPKFSHDQMQRYPTPTCPIGGVTWYEAVAYCNWLSKEEGIPEDQWCYEIKGQVTKLKKNYLSLSGYRLPTEAEMEYATRAGSKTSRYYGETAELLSKYAWYFNNSHESTWPVGSLKPNDLGLFDVQGNVYTWCQESYKNYPVEQAEVTEFTIPFNTLAASPKPKRRGENATEDQEDTLVVNSTVSRVLRGGSYYNQPSNLRSSNRLTYVPTVRNSYSGLRVSRTLPPNSPTASPPAESTPK